MNKNAVVNNPISTLETREIISKLQANGFGDLVECLLENEAEVYTKKGRLNKSGTCREMGWKNKQLEDAIKRMRELLKPDFDLE